MCQWRHIREVGGLNMFPYISKILCVAFLSASLPLLACEVSGDCGKCVNDSEKSWNPESRAVTAQLNRFYELDDLIIKAYKSNDFPTAKILAKESLSLAVTYRCNWNYGNSIHNANQILGLISIKEGDIKSAEQYLIEAGKSTGSPQLDTFGPEFDLANELLKNGKTHTVQAYLSGVNKFWEMDNGIVEEWQATISKDEIPYLSRTQKSSTKDLALLCLSFIWPLLVTLSVFFIKRKALYRKLIFFITSTLASYVLMFIGATGLNLVLAKMLVTLENMSDLSVMIVTYVPLTISFLLPVLATLLISRFFTVKKAA